jgi:hypothetical protein
MRPLKELKLVEPTPSRAPLSEAEMIWVAASAGMLVLTMAWAVILVAVVDWAAGSAVAVTS